jgi:WD40 repeat protein
MHCISDISAHNGYIKCLKVWADKKLLLTASDKSIVLWDMISLTKVGHLEGHKNEIKSLAISTDGNMLFSAGKGSS